MHAIIIRYYENDLVSSTRRRMVSGRREGFGFSFFPFRFRSVVSFLVPGRRAAGNTRHRRQKLAARRAWNDNIVVGVVRVTGGDDGETNEGRTTTTTTTTNFRRKSNFQPEGVIAAKDKIERRRGERRDRGGRVARNDLEPPPLTDATAVAAARARELFDPRFLEIFIYGFQAPRNYTPLFLRACVTSRNRSRPFVVVKTENNAIATVPS